MREPAFTPGPWRWHGEQLVGGQFTIARSVEWWNGNRDANAHLIAAAPALYEALRRVMDTYGFDPSIDSSIWNEAAGALSLALGESPNA